MKNPYREVEITLTLIPPPLVQAMSAIFVVVILIEILESISKCLFGNICFDQNSNENIARISALKVIVASCGLPGRLLGLPENFVSDIINKEAYRKSQKASRKPQGSYKSSQGRNPCNIFVAILVQMMTPKRHCKIN